MTEGTGPKRDTNSHNAGWVGVGNTSAARGAKIGRDPTSKTTERQQVGSDGPVFPPDRPVQQFAATVYIGVHRPHDYHHNLATKLSSYSAKMQQQQQVQPNVSEAVQSSVAKSVALNIVQKMAKQKSASEKAGQASSQSSKSIAAEKAGQASSKGIRKQSKRKSKNVFSNIQKNGTCEPNGTYAFMKQSFPGKNITIAKSAVQFVMDLRHQLYVNKTRASMEIQTGIKKTSKTLTSKSVEILDKVNGAQGCL